MNASHQFNKLIALASLSLTCHVAQAAWVADFAGPQFSVYLDAERITRVEQGARIPTMYNYSSLQTGAAGEKYQSVTLSTEVDCKGERVRLSLLEFHSGPMGRGEIVLSDNEPKGWEPFGIENKATTLWKLACGRQ